MSQLDYIGADELVFNNNKELGIHSGGFSVKSIMMKSGLSPIMTLNIGQKGGSINKVSDLFDNLVVPNWVLSYNDRIHEGGSHNNINHNYDSDDESDDDIIDDELHDKLIELVKQHDLIEKNKTKKNKITRKNKNKLNKKTTTKKTHKIE
jgi:hypothetical protein